MSNKIYSLQRMPTEAFKIFAMSLPHGPNYGNAELLSAWSNEKGLGYGAVLQYSKNSYGLVCETQWKNQVLASVTEFSIVPDVADKLKAKEKP